ncbi:putative phage abortive infection protein [Leptospira wolbachii]|uniref:putative phage abortive infection protein n=1 Tax=Leptospira wolbachii TaxID=29511 RepID=UPI0038BA0203
MALKKISIKDTFKPYIRNLIKYSIQACSSLYLTLISDHFMNYLNFLKELIQYGEKSENKTNYREYIKSILSIDEKRLLFYFSLSDPKLLELSKELDLFINLHPADLISKDHYIFYST